MLFFFYGTLISGSGNAAAEAAHTRLRAVGPASVRGALFAIPDPQGWYPALASGEGQVHGELYATDADFGAEDLARLDAYEDYDPMRPEISLYVRETIMVTRPEGGSVPAEAYRFNRPRPAAARLIPGGDFRAWLEKLGLEAFRDSRA